jgi:hypothetical protein
MKTRPVAAEFIVATQTLTAGQTDIHLLMVRFRNFAKSPKIYNTFFHDSKIIF